MVIDEKESYFMKPTFNVLPIIDWVLIAKAKEYYEGLGYRYTETPWFVSDEAIKVTANPESAVDTDFGKLVGSAEQGFIELIDKGMIRNGQALMSITPCFRKEEFYGAITRPYFMKVELMSFSRIDSPNQNKDYAQMMYEAYNFFKNNCDSKCNFVRTEIGHDIFLNGIEIGSYGTREWNGFQWVYGTGLAEPRFSIAKAKKG